MYTINKTLSIDINATEQQQTHIGIQHDKKTKWSSKSICMMQLLVGQILGVLE